MHKIIAHRGQINGPNKSQENCPEQILSNIKNYPKIINEIDVWINQSIYLGHDFPKHKVGLDFLMENTQNLILHIKNIEFASIESFKNIELISNHCHTFCHEEDDFTLTSEKWIWLHPRNGIKENCIIVMPEKFLNLDSIKDLSSLLKGKGICTDYALKMLKFFDK